MRRKLEEPNSLPPKQLRKLLEALRAIDPMLHVACWTLGLTGLRWGEVTALRWEDVDHEEGVIWIRRKLVKEKLVPSTKTGKRRVVGAPAFLLEMLNRHREWLDETKHPGRRSALLFPSSRSTPLSRGRVSGALRKARKKAGIEQRFTSHGFRRSVTDMLRGIGVDPMIAVAIIGHDTSRMRQHYSTVRPAEVRKAGEQLVALLFPAGPD